MDVSSKSLALESVAEGTFAVGRIAGALEKKKRSLMNPSAPSLGEEKFL